MLSSYSSQNFQVVTYYDSTLTLREPMKNNTSQHLPLHCGREWQISSETKTMFDNGKSRSNEKRPLESSTSTNEGKKPTDKNENTSVFINHATISWHESRERWIGDVSQSSQRMEKDPVISWSTTYEELLSTHECFSEPIPLPEMVDFLVDIWHDEGLFD